MHSEPLSNILAFYPKACDKAMRQLSKEFRDIPDRDFQIAKDRILLFKNLAPLLKKKELDKEACLRILEAVLEGEVEQTHARVNDRGGNKRHGVKAGLNPTSWPSLISSSVRGVWKTIAGESDIEDVVNDLIHRVTEVAKSIPDDQFVSQLDQDMEQYTSRIPQFGVWAERAKHRAFEYLVSNVTRTVKKLWPGVHREQENESAERIRQDGAKTAEEELKKSRVKLIKQVNDLSTKTAYTCVLFLMVYLRLMLFVEGTRCRLMAQRNGTMVGCDPVGVTAVLIKPRDRLVFANIVSDYRFKRLARRPNGNIHGIPNEPDDRRSTQLPTQPECDSYAAVQVRAHVQIAIGLFCGVRLFFIRSHA